MKISLFFFLLFSFIEVNAQKYVFNTLTKYSSNYNNTKNESLAYTNSNDGLYYMIIRKYESSLTANLLDYKNLKVHSFSVTESKIRGEIFFEFDYQKTSNLYFNNNAYSKYVITFQTDEQNDSIRKVKLNVYKNSKKKKTLMTYDIKIKKNSVNLFPAFRMQCLHPFEFLEKLNIFENGIVTNAKGNSLSGTQIEYKLEKLKQIDFELIIPKPEK